jgi:FRG domain
MANLQMSLIEIVDRDESGNPFTACTFLDYFNVAHRRWRRSQFSQQHRYFDHQLSTDWVFRGHENAEWRLLPSFWRADSEKVRSILKTYQHTFSTPQQLTAETWYFQIYLSLLDSFSELAVKKGLIKRVNFRSDSANDSSEERKNELEALAQHYGLPTQLIDWSYDPFVAAFFSSWNEVPSDNSVQTNSFSCVWCLNTSLANRIETPGSIPVNIVKPASITSERIRAQSGLFTKLGSFDGAIPDYQNDGRGWPDLETLISSPAVKLALNDGEEHPTFLRRVMLAKTEMPELLRQLHFRGISYSALFPGFEGIAREVLFHAMLN